MASYKKYIDPYEGINDFKFCVNCKAIIPLNVDKCSFCGYVFLPFVLSKAEKAKPYDDIVNELKDAFLKLESYLTTNLIRYKRFDFQRSLIMLLERTKEPENFKPKNIRYINDISSDLYELLNDIDKGNYKNDNAFENDDFEQDYKLLCKLQDDLDADFYKYSLLSGGEEEERSDVKDINDSPINQDLSLKEIALLMVFQNKHINNDNKDSLAKKFGYKNGNKLIQHYNFYIRPVNRTANEQTKSKLSNKIELFERVVLLLKDKSRIINEIEILKKLFLSW